jgi:hypothetical protein
MKVEHVSNFISSFDLGYRERLSMTSALDKDLSFHRQAALVACDTCLASKWPERKGAGSGIKNRCFPLFTYTSS